MSMRRVSSRPRLVSDADRASQITSIDLDENSYPAKDSELLLLNHQHHDDVHPCDDGRLDISNVVNGKEQQVVASKDDGVKPAAAAIVRNDDNNETSTAAHPPNNIKMSPSIDASDDDNYSDYVSCLFYEEGSSTAADTNTDKSTLNNNNNFLEVALKTTLSNNNSNDDGGAMEAAAAAAGQLLTTSTTTTSFSVKRKRLSQQHYLTPNSSYADLHQNSWYSSPISPLTPPPPVPVALCHNNEAQHQLKLLPQCGYYHATTNNNNFLLLHSSLKPPSFQTRSSNNNPLLSTLPEETLIQIATHLIYSDIRSLGSTCHSIRSIVMTGTFAIETLWMAVLREKFPAVFRGSNNEEKEKERVVVHSSNVNFVDEYMLPIAAITRRRRGGGGLVGDQGTTNTMVNLPLLTGLLAPRYPQMMSDVNDDGLFRSFDMSIPPSATVVSGSGASLNEGDVVPVIQYTGRVGVGDRSVRSDKPFPPNCRVVNSSSSGSSGGGNHHNHHHHHRGASLKDLSSWMKNHTPLRSKGNNKRRGSSKGQHHSLVRDLSPPPPLRHNNRQQLMMTTIPTPRSPLRRFISSLSHSCDCVRGGGSSSSNNSSFVDDEDGADDDDIGSTTLLERTHSDDDDEIGVNDYGMMVRRNGNGLLDQCKQKFGYHKSNKESLCPFVIPTVISSSPGISGDISVDVTPRLVAYFEVTILDQEGETTRTTTTRTTTNERIVPTTRPPQRAALQLNDLRRRGMGMYARFRRNAIPLGAHLFVLDPGFFPVLDAQEHFGGHGRIAPNNNNFGPQPHPMPLEEGDNARQRQQRHDCVAIGLSSLPFRQRSRMPGWDEYSFGYHGDDGGLFHGHGDMLRRYGPRFGPGDNVGCGLEYSTRRIFFTKNGEFLGWAFEKIDKAMIERGLYPTVGVDTESPIHVNFGQVPFTFDWKKVC